MTRRIDAFEQTEPESITTYVGPAIDAHYLRTLLNHGMPPNTNRALTIIKPEVVVKQCGAQYDGYHLTYFGIPKRESEIRTGKAILGVDVNDFEFEVVIWARCVFWQDAKAYFLAFYDALGKMWRRMIVRLEKDPPERQREIGHRLVDGMELAFIQFEGIFRAKREDEISVAVFRQHCFNQIKHIAARYDKLTIQALAESLDLNRDTVSKYLKRDPGLWDELHAAFGLYKRRTV
jgi:hypothetical protein